MRSPLLKSITKQRNLSLKKVFKLIAITGLIGLIWIIVEYLGIEQNYGLVSIFPVVTIGFLIHALLPLNYRPWIFLFCGIICVFILFGLKGGLALISLAAFVFHLTQLSIHNNIKIGLLVMAGVGLAIVRLGYVSIPYFDGIIYIVGSIFMFRGIIYLHDSKFENPKPKLITRINYFFLFPNIVLPLFPVVDYKSYKSTYYNEEDTAIYLKGIRMMIVGVFHMMIYRVIYVYFIPNISEVVSISSFLQYAIFSYMLILRLSGLFHFIIGLLALFGMNLPKVFDHYFLANGFNDLWRRMNIYWKDLMMKIFYYPIFFKIRKIGVKPAIFITVLILFIITWLLHSYQFLWIAGTFPINWNDFIYWTLFGLLIAINSVYQFVNSKQKKESDSLLSIAILGLQTTAMFLFMSFFWSFWVSESVAEWLGLLAISKGSSMVDWLLFLAIVILIYTMITSTLYFRKNKTELLNKFKPQTVAKKILVYSSIMVFLIGISSKTVIGKISEVMGVNLLALTEITLNDADAKKLEKGYYETMVGSNNLLSPYWEVIEKSDREEKKSVGKISNKWKPIGETGILIRLNDFRKSKLKPNMTVEFRWKKFSTNSFGLRDKEYSKIKSDSTFRIALLGASYTLGSGVADGEPYENIVETQLNSLIDDSQIKEIEIWNFSGVGFAIPQYLAYCKSEIFQYDIDMVLVISNPNEYGRMMNYGNIANFIHDGNDLEFEFLKKMVKKDNLETGTDKKKIRRRLKKHAKELYRGFLDGIALDCKKNNSKYGLIFLVDTGTKPPKDRELIKGIADSLGYSLFDLTGVFDGYLQEDIAVSSFDAHPNKLGHQLIAKKLIDLFIQNQDEIGIKFK
jgi:alginate O-acetyltransferase complex protein AlgI